MMKGLQHLSTRLRDMGLSAWRREGLGGILSACINTCGGRVKGMELGSSQWQDKRQWAHTATREVQFKHKKKLFLL